MMFTAKVKYYQEVSGDVKTHNIFVTGDTFREVVEKISEFYGETNLESISVNSFSPDNMLIFEPEREELFTMVESTLAKDVIWQFGGFNGAQVK